MSSAMNASNSQTPSYYFFQSPYLSKEMEACLHERVRVATLARNGVNHLHRLRRGDQDCTFLIDERQRPAIGPPTDRILNPNGSNSSAVTNAATKLTTPTVPIFLYWTDGAKRTLPFQLLKSVSLKRNACRHGQPLDGWNTPDTILSILGGSSALNCKLLDDKCLMQQLLLDKPYVPRTYSFDITQEGWKHTLEQCFDGKETDQPSQHSCTNTCATQFLILKPSQGHKQRGIIILPKCALHLPAALKHCQSQTRPGGLKGIFHTWVVQDYVKEPLCLSGMDLGLLWEGGLEWQKEKRWKKLLCEESTATKDTEEEKSQPKTKRVPSVKRTPSTSASNAAVAPAASPTRTAAASSTDAIATASTSGTLPLRSSIRHTLTVSHPFLPSDSSLPVHIRGLHKLHFRMFAMVRYDARIERYEIYWCNLVKVYHATKPWAMLHVQQTQQPSGGDTEEKQESPSSPSVIPSSPSVIPSNTCVDPSAAAYFMARSNSCDSFVSNASAPATAPFLPLSSLDASAVSLYPCYEHPELDWDASISKYLAMRLAHDIFPAEKLHLLYGQLSEVIVDTIRSSLDAGGMKPCGGFVHAPGIDQTTTPPGLSQTYFQFLGYDFLWDTQTSKPVLLEINNNVGQGLMSQETMSTQKDSSSGVVYGHSNEQYGRMRDYWRTHFRQPFIESVMRVNIDRFHEKHESALPVGSKEPVRLMSSPPKEDENCWILGDVYERKK